MPPSKQRQLWALSSRFSGKRTAGSISTEHCLGRALSSVTPHTGCMRFMRLSLGKAAFPQPDSSSNYSKSPWRAESSGKGRESKSE